MIDAALLAWASLAAATAGAATPPCRAHARLEPSQPLVGQQVLYRLRVLTSAKVEAVEWLEPPAFAALRAERLPGRPQVGEETHDGVVYRVREEHRALFPERAGESRVGAARLRCRTAHGVFEATAPALALRVRELPERDRPADFGGLVGPVAVGRSVEPQAAELGASVRLTVLLQGGGNLWDAPDPYPDDSAFAGAEVFRSRPGLELERGTSLLVRRRFVYELVPRRLGTLRVPELRIPYFDPDAGRYEAAGAAALELAVGPPAARSASPVDAPDRTDRPDETVPGSETTGWWLGMAAAASILGVAAFLGLRRRRIAPGRAGREAPAPDSPAAALARSLRAAIDARQPGAGRLAPEEILADASLAPAARAAAQLLAAAERARFDPEAAAPERAAVERAIRELRHER